MSKKAIVLTTFGVGAVDVKERCIDALIADIEQEFPDYALFEAWTSNFLRKKIAKEGYEKSTLEDVLAQLQQESYTDVVIVLTHLTAGEEYNNKILPVVDSYKHKFTTLVMTRPLLADITAESVPLLEGEGDPLSLYETAVGEELVLMGHGSPHVHNPAYERLQAYADMHDLPMHIGVVEPEDHPNQADVIKRLKDRGVQKVYLRPLLFVGGNHATEDLAGEEPASWRNAIQAAGVEVRYSIKGLAEYPDFRKLYIREIHKVVNNL